jgi:peptidoglycan lytic transglycosylase
MAGAITVSGRGAAQEETKSPAPKAVKKKAADPKANEAQKAKPKPAAAAPASAAKTAARPAGEPKPGGEPRPAGEPKSAGNPRAMAVLPKPSPLAEEAQHVALFDSAITPVRDIAISPDDAKRLREAIAAAAGGRLTEARSLRDGLSEPAGRKLVDWFTFRGGYGTASEIRAFLDANPAWPDRGLLTQRAEEQLFLSNASSRDVRVFFASAEPRTAIGHAALAAALMTDKETDKAKVLARKAWTEMDLPSAAEQAFLARVGGLLDESDHKRRLDRLLLNDVRAADRADRAAVIKRTIALLPEAERKTAEARLAVFMRAKNSQQLIAKLPKHSHVDWGLAVQKAQALSRQKKEEEAWKILLAEPEGPGKIARPDGWWEERRANAYAALRLGKPKTAYDLANNPGPLGVNAAKDAAFLAGWIALRHLKDTKLALPHFEALASIADGPLSHARAQYWLGRTQEALGDKTKAQEHYRAASAYFDTFHGQLARLKVDPGARVLLIKPPAAPTEEEKASFNGSDAVKATVLARKAGLDISLARAFLVHMRSHFRSEAEVAMAAHLAEALGDTQMAVRIGKAGIARGLNLFYYAYPIHSLPAYTPLRTPAEPAVIFGIARQESEFNSVTFSHAGARGILQVMPVTAKHVCRDYKIKCDIPRLMKDPAYNTMLGSAYITDRMDEFTGSYVLTLAGYNAGPGRAREWIKEFGDPRDGKVDPIDWIHRIPFEETREYVQKVLSNIQIYRARLGERDAVRLTSDLKRISAASPTADTAAAPAPK